MTIGDETGADVITDGHSTLTHSGQKQNRRGNQPCNVIIKQTFNLTGTVQMQGMFRAIVEQTLDSIGAGRSDSPPASGRNSEEEDENSGNTPPAENDV